MTLTDALRVQAGEAKITGTCRWCDLSLTDGREVCDECATAPSRVTISNCRYDGLWVSPTIPESGQFEYVRADLVEKMKAK